MYGISSVKESKLQNISTALLIEIVQLRRMLKRSIFILRNLVI